MNGMGLGQKVSGAAPGTVVFKGDWDASGNTIPTGAVIKKGFLYKIPAGGDGVVDGVPLFEGMRIMSTQDNPKLITHYIEW